MTDEALALLIGLGAALVLLLAIWFDPGRTRRTGRRGEPVRRRWEPCWTDRIAGDGRRTYGRYLCVHEDLMELDARAARQDFPIPISYE